MIVRRLHTVRLHKRPQPELVCLQPRAVPPRPGVPAPPTGGQNILELAPQGQYPVDQSSPTASAPAKRVPQLEHSPVDGQEALADPPGRPAPLDQLLPVPLQMGPAELPGVRVRPLAVDHPSV